MQTLKIKNGITLDEISTKRYEIRNKPKMYYRVADNLKTAEEIFASELNVVQNYKYQSVAEFLEHIRGNSDNCLYWLFGTINKNLIVEDMVKSGLIKTN